jgi:hypothetical protein
MEQSRGNLTAARGSADGRAGASRARLSAASSVGCVRSPVETTKSGLTSTALIVAAAGSRVASAFGLAVSPSLLSKHDC